MAELLPIEGNLEDQAEGSFLSIRMEDGREIVGTFKGMDYDPFDTSFTIEAPNGAAITESYELFKEAFHAPMGYRARR